MKGGVDSCPWSKYVACSLSWYPSGDADTYAEDVEWWMAPAFDGRGGGVPLDRDVCPPWRLVWDFLFLIVLAGPEPVSNEGSIPIGMLGSEYPL